MADIIMLGLFAVVIAIFVFTKRSTVSTVNAMPTQSKNERVPSSHSAETHKNYTLQNKHAAVTIVHDKSGCNAVKSLENVRFLVREAPMIPVLGCTQSKSCKCQYRHHVDRRRVERRSEMKLITPRKSTNYRKEVRRRADRHTIT